MIRPTITFRGEDYFVDIEAEELRNVSDPTDILSFSTHQT
jgi:hypothetical protein